MFLLLILSQSWEAKSRQGRLHRSVQHVSVYQTSQRLQTGESECKTQLKAQINVLLFRVASRRPLLCNLICKLIPYCIKNLHWWVLYAFDYQVSACFGQWSAVLLWKGNKNGRLQCVNSSVKDTVKLFRCSPMWYQLSQSVILLSWKNIYLQPITD